VSNLTAWIVGIAAIILIGVIWGYFEGRRAKKLREACEAAGYRFTEDDLGDEELEQLPLFRTGRGNDVRSVWQGQADGVDVRLFDFEYTSGRGDSSKMITQTVVAMAVEGGPIPRFYARPRTVMDKIGTSFGGIDVMVPDAGKLEKRYRIRGDDEHAILDVFTTAAGQWLGGRKGWATEGQGRWVIVFRPGKKVKPKDAVGLIDEAMGFYRLLSLPG
jgi:hypothetical protein